MGTLPIVPMTTQGQESRRTPRNVRSPHAGRADPPNSHDHDLDRADINTLLRESYDNIVGLQKPYDPAKMTVQGPVFPTRSKER
jgi:hypothetical protein